MKVVGRGNAVKLTEILAESVRNSKVGKFFEFKKTYLDAFNKRGELVKELHVLISKK